MAKKSPKPRDANQLAAAVVAQATDEDDQGEQKDPDAVARGSEGGRKRAEGMTAVERSTAARRAAQARWSKVG